MQGAKESIRADTIQANSIFGFRPSCIRSWRCLLKHLHHIVIVQLLSTEPIDGRQHLGVRLASDEGGGDGIDQGGVEEGLIALDIDNDGAIRCAVHRGQ